MLTSSYILTLTLASKYKHNHTPFTSKNFQPLSEYYNISTLPKLTPLFRASPETIANNLMTMTYGATLGELMSLEELVKLLLEKELVSPRVTK